MRVRLLAVVALAVALPTLAADPPTYHDDDAIAAQFSEQLSALAKAGKCLPPAKLRALVEKDRVGTVKPVASDGKTRPAEELYREALPSVFLIGTVVENAKAKGGYDTGRLATAWVLSAEGVLVTNWHVFDEIQDGESYGVRDHTGKAYPLTDILAVDRTRDVVVLKVDAKGLTPLPVADRPPAVGAWVGVLGHPGDRHFTFTQGAVSRFNLFHEPDGKKVSKWMAITAEYAYGSSGSPVLDKTGAVVGMAALTESIDYPLDDEPAKTVGRKRMVRRPDQKPKDDKPKPKEPKQENEPLPGGSVLQMVVKLAVPVTELRAVMGGKE